MRTHVKKKQYRENCRNNILAGMVSMPEEQWVQQSGSGPAPVTVYKNVMEGTRGGSSKRRNSKRR